MSANISVTRKHITSGRDVAMEYEPTASAGHSEGGVGIIISPVDLLNVATAINKVMNGDIISGQKMQDICRACVDYLPGVVIARYAMIMCQHVS